MVAVLRDNVPGAMAAGFAGEDEIITWLGGGSGMGRCGVSRQV